MKNYPKMTTSETSRTLRYNSSNKTQEMVLNEKFTDICVLAKNDFHYRIQISKYKIMTAKNQIYPKLFPASNDDRNGKKYIKCSVRQEHHKIGEDVY